MNGFKNKLKAVSRYLLGATIGYYVLSEIIIVIFIAPFVFKYNDLTYDGLSQFQASYKVLDWLILIATVLIGLYVTKKRNLFYEVFRIKKEALRLDVFFAVISNVALIYFRKELNYLWLLSVPEQLKYIFIDIPWNVLLTTAFFYPFFTLYYYIKLKIKSKNLQNIRIWIFLAFLLNPVFTTTASYVDHKVEFVMFNRPCGVLVDYIVEESPAEKAGMQTGDVITQIDDTVIIEPSELQKTIGGLSEIRELDIQTENDNYKVTPYFDEENDRYKIGIYPVQKYCK